MKNSLELKEERMNLSEELTNIVNGAETRELEDAENSRLAEIRSRIDEIDAELEAIEKENRQIEINNANNTNLNTKETMENKQIRLYDVIKAVVNGNVTDEMRGFVQGSKINFRSDIQAQGTAGTGVEAIPEDKKDLMVAIRNASVLNKLGCTWFGNAVGDISIPRYSGSVCGWKGEIEKADNGEGTFDEVLLQPKRLTAVLNVSKLFLAQTSEDAEAILIRDLADSISEKFDSTIFSADSGTTTRPEGLFYNTGYTATGETLSGVSYQDVLDLEYGVEKHNGTDFVFVANPRVKYHLKGTQQGCCLSMVYNNNEIDGHKAIVSNSVVDGGLMAIAPRDLAVAVWNNLEITVDNTSRAEYGEVRLIVNFYCDAKLRGDRVAAAVFSAE